MHNTFRALFIAIITSLFIIQPISSYADWHGHDEGHGHDKGHGHDGGHGHDRGHDHDRGYWHSYVGINLSTWPDSYYYGVPYYPPADKILVSPPIYQPVVINGTTYYLNNGTYYVYNGYSYQAIVPPVTVSTPGVGDVGDVDSFTVNIPNDQGGYTAVTLEKSGSGYIGPQGEFYPVFPTVAQLKVIYGQ